MSTRAIASRHPLVSQLAARISGALTLEEPYILQDRVPQTASCHVVVIWDEWADMDRTERGRIIVDAFQDAGVKDAVRVAMGLTQQEALRTGYLPYQVVANWKKSDGEPVFRRLKQTIERTPGVHVRTGSSEQLRYPTLEHAQEAYRHVSGAVAGPYWAIVKEEGMAE
ncbi:MAG: hypothetical protein ACHRHE_06850 [Tepidisphaerales bacterium]